MRQSGSGAPRAGVVGEADAGARRRAFSTTLNCASGYGRKAKFNDEITPVRVDCVWISDYL